MILIVDDKAENIFSLSRTLEIHGFDVDTASSGEEALKKILKQDYALIILDVQMPGMDGFEVADAISGFNKAKDIPIIFLSAVNTDKQFITKGYMSGGVDYVTKPVDPDIFMLKVKTLHRLYEQNRELKLIRSSLLEEVNIRKAAEEHLETKVAERTQELELKNRELEASNYELQQFASVASHDLKEPLRKIQLCSSILKESSMASEPSLQLNINRIISSAARMNSLINDLIDHSRLSIEMLFEEVSLDHILSEVLSDLELSIQEKGALIVPGTLPELQAIPGQMRQVFQNLISNSLKFSRSGIAPEIVIGAERVTAAMPDADADTNGLYVRIVISDNGIGFDEQYLDKVFTIFQRLNPKDAYEGTGIGLAIVKKIIEKHNGIITGKSSEGQGATFILVLPLQQAVAEPDPNHSNQYNNARTLQ